MTHSMEAIIIFGIISASLIGAVGIRFLIIGIADFIRSKLR